MFVTVFVRFAGGMHVVDVNDLTLLLTAHHHACITHTHTTGGRSSTVVRCDHRLRVVGGDRPNSEPHQLRPLFGVAGLVLCTCAHGVPAGASALGSGEPVLPGSLRGMVTSCHACVCVRGKRHSTRSRISVRCGALAFDRSLVRLLLP